MFLDKPTEDEFFASLEKNLNEQHSFEENLHDRRASDIQAYLEHAASALVRAGLRKEAECVTLVSKKVNDKSTKDHTSEQLLEWLRTVGWTFPPPHDSDSCMTSDKEPQLSQEELKRLRKLLSK